MVSFVNAAERKKKREKKEQGGGGYKSRVSLVLLYLMRPDAIDSPKSVPRRAHESLRPHTHDGRRPLVKLTSSVAGGTSATALPT